VWQPAAGWVGGLASPSMEVGHSPGMEVVHARHRQQIVIVVGSPCDQNDLSMDWVTPCQPMPAPWNEGPVPPCENGQDIWREQHLPLSIGKHTIARLEWGHCRL